MRGLLVALACAAPACAAPAAALAQARPDSAARATTEYDAATDSTTRRVSVYAMVDTSAAPPDTLAVELVQRWRGRGTDAPAGPVELGLGHTRLQGLRPGRTLLWSTPRRPAVVLLVDGARRIRLEQSEYVSDGGRAPTFETARYVLSAADLRLIAASRELRVWVGERELWIDPGWRRVVAGLAP